MTTVTPLQREFREILQHIAQAERLASHDDNAQLLAALKVLEAATVDIMFDQAI